MDRSLELALIDQALDQLARRTTDMAEHGGGAPVSHYVSEARYRAEVDTLFRRFPLGLAHTGELPNPGDYLVREVAGLSIILIRGADGIARAFLNACRHRGALLLDRCQGNAANIVCPYHAWSYRTDGSLVGIPGPDGFRDLDRATHGLLRYPSIERYGVIWVLPTCDAQPDWAAWFEPVERELAALSLQTHQVFSAREVSLDANWKVVSDAFMEGYHFRFVHRDSVFPMYFDNQGVFDPMGPHYRYFLPHRSIETLKAQPRERWRLRQHCLMVYQLFPATSIQVLPDHVFLHTLLPAGPGRTIARNLMLVPEAPATDKARAYWEKNKALVQGALDEDHAIAERVQRGIAAGCNPDLVFGRYEQGIVHLHAQVQAVFDGRLTVPSAAGDR